MVSQGGCSGESGWLQHPPCTASVLSKAEDIWNFIA